MAPDPTRIMLTANLPIALGGQWGAQAPNAGEVYTWDSDAARYGPQPALERLVTHDTGSENFELVYHTDGSPVWH